MRSTCIPCSNVTLAAEYTRDNKLGNIDHTALAQSIANLSTVFAHCWEPKKPWVLASKCMTLLGGVILLTLLTWIAFGDINVHVELAMISLFVGFSNLKDGMA